MKKTANPLFILIWTIIVIFLFRIYIIANWKFDIIAVGHWLYLKRLWDSGWVFSTPSEWKFLGALFGIPVVWILGIKLFQKIKNILLWPFKIIFFPITFIFKKLTEKKPEVEIKKKKIKVKKIMPQEVPAKEVAPAQPPKAQQQPPAPKPAPKAVPVESIDNDEFEEEDDDDFTPVEVVPAKKEVEDIKVNQVEERQAVSSGGVKDILEAKGFNVLEGLSIAGVNIDYIGVGAKNTVLCMLDNKGGDWLADEERFNDEDPLWFSESTHRVSPVQLLNKAKNELVKNLRKNKKEINVEAILVFIKGKIINAEDMVEVWSGLKVRVARAEEGAPEKLPTLDTALPESGGAADAALISAVQTACV